MLCGPRKQEVARLRSRHTQRDRGDLDSLAGDGCALIRDTRSVTKNDNDTCERDVEFFRNDLSESRANPRPKIDVAVEGRDRSICVDPDESLESGFRRPRCCWTNNGERSR